MKTTIIGVRKLLKELKKKYPNNDCSIEIKFSSWSNEHLQAYVSDKLIDCTKHYNSTDEVRKTYNL